MKIIEAIQKIYPEIKGGFSYWETQYDGTSHENPIDGLVWENTEFEKPTWEQIDTFLPTPLEEKRQTKRNELTVPRLAYLQKTDWYVAREIDEPNSYPQKIKDRRILARKEINAIEACTTLTALNEFSTTFK